jgi:hypothetical protein
MIGALPPIGQMPEVDGSGGDRSTLVIPIDTFGQPCQPRRLGGDLYDH